MEWIKCKRSKQRLQKFPNQFRFFILERAVKKLPSINTVPLPIPLIRLMIPNNLHLLLLPLLLFQVERQRAQVSMIRDRRDILGDSESSLVCSLCGGIDGHLTSCSKFGKRANIRNSGGLKSSKSKLEEEVSQITTIEQLAKVLKEMKDQTQMLQQALTANQVYSYISNC